MNDFTNWLSDGVRKLGDLVEGTVYTSSYPEAAGRWVANQPNVDLFFRRVTQVALGIIALNLGAVYFKGFHHSAALGIYLFTEVLVISPAVKKFYEHPISIPLYFKAHELASANGEKALTNSQHKLRETIGKSSLIYRLYKQATHHLEMNPFS